jgi:AcrR family transcriptional regulator
VAELSACDYADVSIESIAARAGVHKTTVYRRWGSKPELISQVLAGAAVSRIPVPDTGSVDEDLRALARAVQAILSAPQGAAITRALVVGGLTSPEIAGVMSQFWAGRLAAISVIVDRAVERRELPAGTDPALLMHAVAAPLYYELLVTQVPITERDADRGAASALAAARAGVFSNPLLAAGSGPATGSRSPGSGTAPRSGRSLPSARHGCRTPPPGPRP